MLPFRFFFVLHSPKFALYCAWPWTVPRQQNATSKQNNIKLLLLSARANTNSSNHLRSNDANFTSSSKKRTHTRNNNDICSTSTAYNTLYCHCVFGWDWWMNVKYAELKCDIRASTGHRVRRTVEKGATHCCSELRTRVETKNCAVFGFGTESKANNTCRFVLFGNRVHNLKGFCLYFHKSNRTFA